MYHRPVLPGRAQLEKAREEAMFWRNVAALAPYARSAALPPFRRQNRRRLWPRPIQIPLQRQAPPGLPTYMRRPR